MPESWNETADGYLLNGKCLEHSDADYVRDMRRAACRSRVGPRVLEAA